MRLLPTVCLLVITLCCVGSSKRQRSKADSKKRLAVQSFEKTHFREKSRKKHKERLSARRSSRRSMAEDSRLRKKLEKRRRKKTLSRRSGESLTFSNEGSDDGIFEEFRPTTFDVSGFNSAETPSDLEQAEKTISGNDDYVQNVSLRDPARKWPVAPIVSILRSATGKRRLQSKCSVKRVTFAPKIEIIPSYIGRRSKVRNSARCSK